jgi:threonine dehydratase
VIGIEATGAPTLKHSMEAGKLITLDKIDTRAGTLAPRRSADLNFQIISNLVEDIILVSDKEMENAAKWLWQTCGLGVELSAAAAIAALQSNKIDLAPENNICAIICGAGPDGF